MNHGRASQRRARLYLLVALAGPLAAHAADTLPDDELLEFLGSVEADEDADFDEYLAVADVQRVTKVKKPPAPAPGSDKP
jgi:hypothetical protein